MASFEPHPEPFDASSESQAPREPGFMRGLIHIPDNFDDPLPDWLLDAFEGVERPSED